MLFDLIFAPYSNLIYKRKKIDKHNYYIQKKFNEPFKIDNIRNQNIKSIVNKYKYKKKY